MSNSDTANLASNNRPRLVIAGAGGSIGTAMCRHLAQEYEIVALTSSPRRPLEAALAGADFAIYLLRTTLPTSRLTQAQSEDTDILLADNFARAAGLNHVKQIIYLGGLVPESNVSSQVLTSRNEIAQTLESHDTPVTALWASLVVGPGSSAVSLLMSLVSRISLVPVPRWACGRKQPIALVDVVRAVRHCLGNPETYGGQFDIGGPDVTTYAQILEETASALGKKRTVMVVPGVSRRLYRWWVRLMDRKAHPELVRLLVDAIQYDQVVKDNALHQRLIKEALPCREALDAQLRGCREGPPLTPRAAARRLERMKLNEESRVRSIQRFKLPPGRNAAWVAETYFHWLSRFLWPFVVCEIDAEGTCHVNMRLPRLRLLTLTFKPDHSAPDRHIYFITGGILAKAHAGPVARFEFRDVLANRFTIGAIHDFAPALPWKFYSATQARIHLFVMRSFERYLARLSTPLDGSSDS
jgi:uncharacterized protein YbjT (DUF2867 family)